jgi:Flp pilus assembly protein TadD
MRTLLDNVQSQPGHDEVSAQIGLAYLAHLDGNNEEALRILNETLQGNGPHRAELLFMKGFLHREMGQNEQALRAFEEAQNSEPPLWLAVRITEQLKTNQ